MLAAFSGAIYLLTDANELFWITTGAAPMHRRAASVSSRLPEAAAGAAFHVQGGRLRIGSAMAIDLEGACVWHAPALHPDSLLDLTELPDIIRAFFSGLDLPEARGFGIFIPDILALSTGGIAGPPSESADPILRRARPLVLDAARACLEHRPGPNLQALVGLGAGLTPSGDDFLGGLLFALNTLQAAFPASPFGDHAIPVGSWEARTHPISFTLLQDLAGGHAVAPLPRLLNGLLEATQRAGVSWNEHTASTAIAPSPTAPATRLVEPYRTSPAAKTQGRLVSSGSGSRSSGQAAGRLPLSSRSSPVRM